MPMFGLTLSNSALSPNRHHHAADHLARKKCDVDGLLEGNDTLQSLPRMDFREGAPHHAFAAGQSAERSEPRQRVVD